MRGRADAGERRAGCRPTSTTTARARGGGSRSRGRCTSRRRPAALRARRRRQRSARSSPCVRAAAEWSSRRPPTAPVRGRSRGARHPSPSSTRRTATSPARGCDAARSDRHEVAAARVRHRGGESAQQSDWAGVVHGGRAGEILGAVARGRAGCGASRSRRSRSPRSAPPIATGSRRPPARQRRRHPDRRRGCAPFHLASECRARRVRVRRRPGRAARPTLRRGRTCGGLGADAAGCSRHDDQPPVYPRAQAARRRSGGPQRRGATPAERRASARAATGRVRPSAQSGPRRPGRDPVEDASALASRR